LLTGAALEQQVASDFKAVWLLILLAFIDPLPELLQN